MTISLVERMPSNEEVYRLLRPYVAEWFRKRYGEFTPPQLMAIPEIKAGRSVLISSPTGTGKTLAVFLALLDTLYEYAERNILEDQIYVVYVSPLRALNNDMHRNLLEPIKGITSEAEKMGYNISEIKVAVRTSDTSPSEKQKMLRNPPHILITTPESLSIILVAPKFREKLRKVKWIVVDEIHEIAGSKRGSHLSLSIERLENLVGHPLIRIGLSATIAPLEEVAKFLVGFNDNGEPRSCRIVDARFTKPMDIRVLCPVKDLVHTPADEVNEAIYHVLVDLIRKHRTTLVFTNTRSATERVVYKLRKLFEKEGILDADEIEAHHSSLSRDIRLGVEEKLKRGELRVVVSSTSLELGIDIGWIDLVVLLSSPKSVSRLLQRVGRSGHHIRQVSKGRVIVVDRDDLVENAVLVKAALERKIDHIRIPRNPLDVLAQHIVGMALEKKWRVEEAYQLVKRSYTFHTLEWGDFINVIRYLSGRYRELFEDSKVYAKIWFDEGEGVFGRRRGSRMIYYLNTGTIPDEAKIRVFTIDDRKYVGDLEEEFAQILAPGDIFVLGGRTYEYVRGDVNRIYVKRVEGIRPTVPSWFSEMLPLAFDSALEVARFRRIVSEMITEYPKIKVIEWLINEYLLEPHAAEAIYEYFMEQLLFTNGIIPSDKILLVELWSEDHTFNIIFHALYGRRANNALSRAYAYLLSHKTGSNIRITVSDNGFMLTLPYNNIDVDVVELVYSLNEDNIENILKKVLRYTELLKRRFRHCAERSFMILRRYKGVETSLYRRQVNAQTLLRIIEKVPDFPVLKETFREILEDYMNINAAKKILRWLHNGAIDVKVIGPNNVPSPFAHNLVAQGYSDVVLMEDRRRLLELLHKRVMEFISSRKTFIDRNNSSLDELA